MLPEGIAEVQVSEHFWVETTMISTIFETDTGLTYSAARTQHNNFIKIKRYWCSKTDFLRFSLRYASLVGGTCTC